MEAHWFKQLRDYGVKNIDRFEFMSFHETKKKLKNRDLSNTIVVMDEMHKFVEMVRSAEDLNQLKDYSKIYSKFHFLL